MKSLKIIFYLSISLLNCSTLILIEIFLHLPSKNSKLIGDNKVETF